MPEIIIVAPVILATYLINEFAVPFAGHYRTMPCSCTVVKIEITANYVVK